MLVTIVNPVPTNSFGADFAVRAENCGESATTVNPHINKIVRKTKGDK